VGDRESDLVWLVGWGFETRRIPSACQLSITTPLGGVQIKNRQAAIGVLAAKIHFARAAVISTLIMLRGARVSTVGKLQCGTPGSDGRQLWADSDRGDATDTRGALRTFAARKWG
jgi:hypothetical protein